MKRYRYFFLTIALAILAAVLPGLAGAAPATKLTTYTHPSGLWSLQYPADLFKVEKLNDNVVIFISKDRHTVAAVDTFLANADAYGGGTDGSVLIGQAQATLKQIYGRAVKNTGTITAPKAPWEIGMTFSTTKGSLGEGVYEQRGRSQSDYRINGFLFGYKAYDAAKMLPILQAMRASYKAKPVPGLADLQRAREVLVRYFKLLHDGYYDEAAKLYSGSYDVLASWNPDVPASHHGQLFAAACATPLRCVEVRRVAWAQATSAALFEFTVEFKNNDGTIFEQKPCCGASGPPNSQFTYTVEKRNGELRTTALPVYVP